ncbi:MAG: TPM domain-containing protein [Candidatus Aminicenantes bacterium]|nr:TPM domain-containing protein [Candidatus Aminicenantes bacterium]
MRKTCLSLFFFLVLAGSAPGLDVPDLTGRVNDFAGILEPDEKRMLENYLASVEASTSAQMVLLTIPSLEGDPIEDVSLRVAEAWKLGRRDTDNGLLLLVAVEDREVRIEVGYGLEGVLPDGKCGTIIRQVIVPEFRNGNHYEGISKAFEVMGQTVAGDPSQLKVLESHEEKSNSGVGTLFIVLILISIVLKIVSPCRKGRWYSSRSGGGWQSFGSGGFTSGGSSGPRSFGGSSGGGFRGGGGSFGGGGASGRW